MKPLLILFLFFNLIGAVVFAQSAGNTVDSLKKLVAPALNQADNTTIDRLNNLAEEYFESQPDSAYYYSALALKLATKNNYLQGMAGAYLQLAAVNTFKSNYQIAADNFNKALSLYQQLKDNYGISEAYIGLGRAQDYLGNYDNAIRFFNMALSIRKSAGDEMDIANCYAIIGITRDNKGEFSKALDSYFKALMIDLKHKDELATADNYCNIGVIMQHLELYPKALAYFNKANSIWLRLKDRQGISTASQNIGEVLLAQKKYAGAFRYISKASSIFHAMGDQEGISLVYNDLGAYYYHTGQPDSALHYFNLSLQSASANKIKYNKAYAYVGLAMVYNQQKSYKAAYNYALQAQNTANNLGSLNIKAEATLQVSNALMGLNQFKQALLQHQFYSALRDSLKNDDNIQKIISYNMAIDYESKQVEANKQQSQQEAILRQKIADQKRANYFYALVIIFMGLMLFIYYNAKRKQQQINELLTLKNQVVVSQKADLDIQANKLNELNILKDRLIAILAHDLRAPLSTLRGLFALMTIEGITQEEFMAMTPRVFSKLEYTSDFLDTLLFWINSQVDDTAQTTKNFSLYDLAKQEIILLDDLIRQKELIVINKVAKDAIVLADPGSIRIVIHNFLTNAIKFSGRGTTMEMLSYQQNDTERVFVLKDQGMGMDKKQLNSLFKTKVTSTPGTQDETGTGMGLLFCKDLIEKYHGKIWAASVQGQGAELYFMLPAGDAITDGPALSDV